MLPISNVKVFVLAERSNSVLKQRANYLPADYPVRGQLAAIADH